MVESDMGDTMPSTGITDITTIDLSNVDIVVLHGRITQEELLTFVDTAKDLPNYEDVIFLYGDMAQIEAMDEEMMNKHGWCRCEVAE